MTRDELVTIIQTRLGFRSDKSTEIIAEMKLAQIEQEGGAELPWFLLSEMASADCTADEERLLLPTDFLREYEYGFLYRYDSAEDDPWVELEKDDYGSLKAAHTGTSEPLYYALRGNYLTLHPTPDAIYAFKMVYYKQDTVLSSNVANEWTAHAPDVLMNLAGMRIAGSLKDQAANSMFAAAFARAVERLHTDTIARHEAGATQNMGDD